MQNDENAYLQQMGIDTYQLAHPQRLTGYQALEIALPSECKLLLVSPNLPQGDSAVLFERVLKSMKLSLQQALHLYPEQLPQLSTTQIEWLWFAGCASNSDIQANVLTSPLITEIEGNTQHRKALWQQICSYN
ncbi:DNA polymerase III subunit psi [Vibrio intestinalis]|uniref:DNA polymerase III subunit psi n=1 Tax=Vibrio intestinalis TaxID=2933291 RepID=UPI0021A349AE|nr:DNA polymerase III subunit psi [Vibrio intestinalis]